MRTTTLVLVPVSSTVCSRAMAQPVMTLVAPTPPGQSLEEPTEESGSPPRERNHGIRPRYGFSLGFMGGGGETTLRTGRFGPSEGVTPGFGGELQGRIGVQFEDHVALFYQGSFTGAREVAICLNATSTERPCPPTDDALFLHTSSAIIDFTFARGVQIGIGGSMALAHFATDHASTNVRAGYLFRAGYAFGGDGPGARQGFTIGFQGSLSVVVEGERPGPLVDLAVSLGWESF